MRFIYIIIFSLIVAVPLSNAQSGKARTVLVTSAVVENGVTTPNIALTGSAFFTQTSNVSSESASKITEVFVKDGDMVKKGQPIAQLDNSFLTYSILSAEAETKQALLTLEKTKRDYERNKTLYSQNSISLQKYQDSLTDYQNAENAYKAADANEKKLKTEKEKMTIKAPFDGVVIDTPIEVGEWMTLGGTAATLASLTYEARVYLPEKLLPFVRAGIQVPIIAANKEFIGTIQSINPKGDASTRTFEAKIFIGEDASLKEGVQTVARIPSGESIEAMLVPRDAVVDKSSIKGVYKISNNVVRFIQVNIVGYSGKNIAVHSEELSAGDQVVMKGNDKVQDGTKITIAAN